MMIVLGIDQGGSHTWAAIGGVDGRLLALGSGGGASHAGVGMERAMAEVDRAARIALRIANIEPRQLSLIFGGLTGADWPDEYLLLRENIQALDLCQHVEVTNDSIIALRGGTSKPYGAVLIAGSGGNVAVRSPAGEEFHYGYFHDAAYQGGGALAEHAFTAICRAHSFRAKPTLLADLFCAHYGLKSLDALTRAHFDGRLKEGAELAPLVFEACRQGDSTAAEIICRFAEGYAEMARALLERYGMQQLDVEMVLSGGVFKSTCVLLRETLLSEVRRSVPLVRLVDARYEPVVGAVLLGLERLGIDTSTPEFQTHLDESAHSLGLVRKISG
jgi:N-acetylglucosamine kinase-like BadF-type ATPase